MTEYGVNTRAQFFKSQTKDLSYIQGGKWIDIPSKNNIQSSSKAPIIFEWGHMNNFSYNFRDSRLIFKLKIVNSANNAAPAVDNKLIRPVNGIGITFWKRIELYINNVAVHSNQIDIGLKHMIDTMLEKSNQTTKSDKLWGFKYVPLEHDEIMLKTNDYFNATNIDQLRNWTTYIVKIPLDIFRSSVNIPSLENVSYELRLFPHDDAYLLNYGLANQADPATELETTWSIRIKPDIKFRLRCDKMSEAATHAHLTQTLNQKIPYRIWYRPTAIRSFTILPDSSYEPWTNIFPREKPIAIWITFVKQNGHMGSRIHNPFYLHPGPGFQSLSVYSDGELIGESKPLEIDLTQNESLKELYSQNLAVLGNDVFDIDTFWSHTDLAKGYFVWGVPLKPTSEGEGLTSMTHDGQITGAVRYRPGVARTDTYICFWYAIMSMCELQLFYDGTVINNFSM